MKNYILFVCLFLSLLTSCAIGVETSTTDEKEQKHITTLEIQDKVSTDTVLYKVYEKGGTVYLINPKTNVVVKTMELYYSWVVNFIVIAFFIILLLGAFVFGSSYN
jgi:hypothetical protein